MKMESRVFQKKWFWSKPQTAGRPGFAAAGATLKIIINLSRRQNCSYRPPLAAKVPKVQQGDNSRQLKWHQAHKNFYDRHPDYDPPKHRWAFYYNKILKRTIEIVFSSLLRTVSSGGDLNRRPYTHADLSLGS
jgi:hypothetical protein